MAATPAVVPVDLSRDGYLLRRERLDEKSRPLQELVQSSTEDGFTGGVHDNRPYNRSP